MSESVRFGDLDISFDELLLRPRAWTLAQATWGAQLLVDRPEGRVLELCSGAGQIGLSLGMLVPHELVLVDIDPHASAHALANTRAAGLWPRVDIRTGPMQTALLEDEEFALILADPPWVPSAETGRFPSDPLLAIDGGAGGMDVARQCVDVIDRHLAEDGDAILQLGTRSQCTALADVLAATELAIGEVREFGVDGVLAHLRRGDRDRGGFIDCRGQRHAVDSSWEAAPGSGESAR